MLTLNSLFSIYRDFHKVTEVRMNLMYITFYHFWFWILATGQRRCLKWERKMSAENFWSQKVVHCTFPSFDSISLKQTYCILYGKYCSVKCRRKIRKFLQNIFLSFWKNLLSDSYKKSLQTSANKLRYPKFYEGNSPGLIKVWLWVKMQMKCLNSFFYYLFQELTLPCI